MPLSNRIALVTGGSLGIGRAAVLAIAAAGADVAFTYFGFRHHADEASEVVRAVEALGRKCIAIEANVADFESTHQIVDRVKQKLGGLHLLVNNAGIARDATLWKMTEAQWDDVIAVDLKGCFNFVHAVAPVFREQQFGKIVNIASINGLRGKFGQANYAAAKAGVIALTKTAAKELGKSNVNVNAIAPGMIATDMYEEIPQAARDAAIGETVLGRVGTPEDVAALIVFLLSEHSRHITGEVIKVDGGQYI